MIKLVAVRRVLAAPIVLAALVVFCAPVASGQIINTVAGGGTGDGGAATSASLITPTDVVIDSAGNLFIADQENHRIRKVSTSGVITTVAGNGSQGFSGDGGPAFIASLNKPSGVALDTAGNLYIADRENHRIRKVDTRGIISTVAGTGMIGFSGDGGIATSAALRYPTKVAVDGAGNFFIADWQNHRIRKVSTSGVITTVAGTGADRFSGDGGAATSAALNLPFDVTTDSAGNLYIADYGNERIRKVNSNGIISTVAGTDTYGFNGDNRTATSAMLYGPTGVAIDNAGNLLIADSGNHRIRKVDATGVISSVAGNGSPVFSGDGGAATSARLNAPNGVAVDSAGNLYIVDTNNEVIRKIDSQGVISTVAGSFLYSFRSDGTIATSARLNGPGSVAIDSQGNIYFADSHHRIRKVSASGVISIVAGNGSPGFSGDGGPATSASLNSPLGVAMDGAGNLYIADYSNHRIRKVSSSGVISTVAGNGSPGFSGDGGAATSASLNSPVGVTLDGAGNLYIADFENHRIRRMNVSGVVSTVAGNGVEGFSGDGGAATSASLRFPRSVAIDRADNLYIADYGNERIRKVDTRGIINSVAGNGSRDFSGDGGSALSASLSAPLSVTVDGAGNLYIADMYNSRIRKVNASGVISTVAGNGEFAFSGDGGIATNASLYIPAGVTVDGVGNLYIADLLNHRIRKVAFGYQGAWWAGSGENGWGLSFIQHGQTLAVGWYYFNAQGQPTWAIVPGCAWNSANTTCTGNVTASTGSWLGNYSGILTQNIIGTATFSFTSPTTGTMSWNIGGVSGTKAISKLNYASGALPSGIDYTDIWWAGPTQNGWGVALLQQGVVLAGSWYTYNQQNQPIWYLINGGAWTSPNVFTAPLTRATGSPLIGATYNPSALNVNNAGTVTITFTDSANAAITYTVDGVSQTKTISRLAF